MEWRVFSAWECLPRSNSFNMVCVLVRRDRVCAANLGPRAGLAASQLGASCAGPPLTWARRASLPTPSSVGRTEARARPSPPASLPSPTAPLCGLVKVVQVGLLAGVGLFSAALTRQVPGGWLVLAVGPSWPPGSGAGWMMVPRELWHQAGHTAWL